MWYEAEIKQVLYDPSGLPLGAVVSFIGYDETVHVQPHGVMSMDDARRAAEEATQQLQPVSNISCLEELFAPLDNKAEDGLESESTSFEDTSNQPEQPLELVHASSYQKPTKAVTNAHSAQTTSDAENSSSDPDVGNVSNKTVSTAAETSKDACNDSKEKVDSAEDFKSEALVSTINTTQPERVKGKSSGCCTIC